MPIAGKVSGHRHSTKVTRLEKPVPASWVDNRFCIPSLKKQLPAYLTSQVPKYVSVSAKTSVPLYVVPKAKVCGSFLRIEASSW